MDADRERWLQEFAEALAKKLPPPDGEDQFSLLEHLAADPASGLYELAPGVWCVDRTGRDSAR